MKFFLLLALASAGQAQVPQSSDEAARYTGLHAAACKGDVAAIRSAPAAGLNSRDGYGRTPLQVATFAGQREAVRALVARGADLGLLENDRYDCVTIAAADDEETLRAAAATARW
jgi:hypothetical protein